MSKPIVLVVEDHPVMRDTLVRVIEVEGMHALGVSRGEDVLRVLKKYTPDVAILDVDLAGKISGVDVLRAIRTSPKYRNLPVIMHTSESCINTLPEAKLADLIMLKPADPDELILMVKRLLRARKSVKAV